MATDNSNARGIHVSPGVYSREVDMTYAVKSLGITTLGAVGETQRGPAFQPTLIENWRDFVSTFGGTNPEKFKGSQYPKYELPYIAKSYLTESKQLQVCRVLGIGGYNAGPAWAVTAEGEDKQKQIVAVLRSRGSYSPYKKRTITSSADCACATDSYDTITYLVGEQTPVAGLCNAPKTYNMNALDIKPYTPLYAAGNECIDYFLEAGEPESFNVSTLNKGRFKIVGWTGEHSADWSGSTNDDDYFEYPVSLNPADKEYIFKVLGATPDDADAPVYVETLYDVALGQAINNDEVTKISSSLTEYNVYYAADYCGLEQVYDLMDTDEDALSRKDVGRRFLATEDSKEITVHEFDYVSNKPYYNSLIGKTVAEVVSGDVVISDDALVSVQQKVDKRPIRHIVDYWKNIKDTQTTATIDNVRTFAVPGYIYTVVQSTDASGKRHYYYRSYNEASVKESFEKEWERASATPFGAYAILDRLVDYNEVVSAQSESEQATVDGDWAISAYSYKTVLVKNAADGLFYRITPESESATSESHVSFVDCDLNDYKSAYRYSSTPWIVSNLKGDYTKFELNRLFRFHTISDGNSSVNEVKVSIENIRPDEGVFDVVVRAIDDSDYFPVVLEKFSRCSLIPGTSNYIALKIGSFDGVYELKSKFITVEVQENTATKNSVPAGFMGYPIASYNGTTVGGEKHDVKMPSLKYNLNYDEDVKNKKQYFGLSDLVGVDVDSFTFKGNLAYVDLPAFRTKGFHLDSRLNDEAYLDGHQAPITVDGESGWAFEAVSTNNRTSLLSETPVIGKESEMAGSIYENVNLRKFTVYFYGGFDGWDVYRAQRSTGDEFKLSKYLGQYNEYSGEGFAFNKIMDPEALGLNQNGITSDWYAYLAGARQFANPEAVDINVFVTPGIDYVNNKLLVEEIIEMVEEERADSIYVVTTPDKPSGAGDFVDEMYTPEDAVYNLEDSEIDSNYTCTYYPWVKYFDNDNNQYIFLPATKDVVRNMAMTDNTTYPWFAPAGIGRGNVDCVRARFITKMGEEDALYGGRINPVKTFSSEGVKLWGQKNLQIKESQLNRIAVRRLLLRMRKLISIACLGMIFDPNDPQAEKTFRSTVEPILNNIRGNRGISDYRIEINRTEEARERRELPAKIFFKPYDALEYITLDFVLTPESVSFDNI